MASEWVVRTIAECASAEPYATQIGPFGKALMADEYADCGVPVLRGINVNRGRFHDHDFVFIDEATANRLTKFESFPDDVLLVHKGTLGQIGLMPQQRKFKRYIMGNSMMRVKCDHTKLLPGFLYYWLCSEDGQHYLFSRVSQVGVPQIQRPLSTLREASLAVPPVQEQGRIVHILGTLDDKIELNRKMNEALEAMARALFQSWFVAFDPVRAKAEGRPTGIPADIAALFPDSFQPSELGEIPVGWQEKPLGDVASYLNRGISPKYMDNGGVLVLNQKCVRGGKIDQSKGRRHDPAKRSIDGRILRTGDILVNSTGVGTLGRVAQLLVLHEEAIVDSHVTVVRANEADVSWNYLGTCLTIRESEIEALGEGSTGQTELPRLRLAQMSILIPAAKVMKEFDRVCIPLRRKIVENEAESRTLIALRDTLLPKLISGEVRVGQAQQAMMEAGI